ncbi:TatD family hydrolase [Microbacterium enclense]|uniref:TatD family hydrolase n=1 Tax=Microbacterium enclense TaxID=993073 RepID=UPI0021A3CB75|nr:TatD family hydrolase [Microbacterium enclense]MCT2085122.1 TatD family hydrolase [Microbacterium enclense]
MFRFPPLDCHAHIAPDVTAAQVRTLNGAQVFAMTRTLEEFDAAQANPQQGLIWGVGVHPGVPTALTQWSRERFVAAADQAVLIGEVGLDRRGDQSTQRDVFRSILRDAPAALISVHSTGRAREVVDLVEEHPHPGIVLHWFTGTPADAQRAAAAGCFFSINAAMTDEQMTVLPLDRVLPETDFPSSRSRTQARTPGDTAALEKTVVRLTRQPPLEVRRRWYQNLAALTERAAVQDKLPSELRQLVATAQEH